MIINGAKNKSQFQNVKFKYLSGLKKNKKNSIKEFIILGSVNFYKTNVDIKNVVFEKISSEDAINIINSTFSVQNAEFIENNSDSLDFDFSEGEIENVNFEYIGNDAIDFSGSKVNVKNAKFFDIKDKVISIGENSNVKIKNIEAVTSNVGIATKDGSIVYAENILMDEVKIPFAAYNKKSEYGNSLLYLKNIGLNNFEEKWLVDNNSKIFYKNANVGKISKDIMKIIYKDPLN